MSSKKGGFIETFEFGIMPKVYGIGAAIVICGAMFKIMHWPFAGPMLVVGLSTEALIFLASAFLPPHREPAWERVYPQLAEDYPYEEPAEEPTAEGLTQSLSTMMNNANINQDVINKLGTGLANLTQTVHNLGDLTNAAIATNEYSENVKAASKSLVEMNKSYSKTVEAMSEMANATQDAREYHSQVQNITKNLGALNAVYEMELQDANNHLKAMNKFYANLSTAMDSMAEASKDTQTLREEVAKLSKNLASLNVVYGNMLSAMKG
ncbi:MAG: gliding motility protein GldL [Cytophagaceae bacterium]|nr:gliding motility protein GldL [Cytophagaceae bacterium]MDW8457016.1 gliding motility protein GldL [Cytophagaceae bacterium]